MQTQQNIIDSVRFEIATLDESFSHPILEEMRPHRRLDYGGSRQALSNLLAKEGFDRQFPPELINHHRIVDAPGYVGSFAHTKGVGAAALAGTDNIYSVGIDLEEVDREVSESNLRFFMNDREPQISPLEIWVLKEAIYKALTPRLLDGKASCSLKKIYLKAGGLFAFGDYSGSFSLKKVEYQKRTYLVGLAATPV